MILLKKNHYVHKLKRVWRVLSLNLFALLIPLRPIHSRNSPSTFKSDNLFCWHENQHHGFSNDVMKAPSSIIKWAIVRPWEEESCGNGKCLSNETFFKVYALKNSFYFHFQDVNITKKCPSSILPTSIFAGWTDIIQNNPYHFDTFLPQTLTLWLVQTDSLFSNQSYHRDSMIFCSSLS